jgi:para-nitrobenzyl esterase
MTWKRVTRALLCVLVACGGETGSNAGLQQGAAGSAPAADSGGIVSIASGMLQGDLLGSGVRRFLKIPYAKPPLGDLRWKRPQAPDPWMGVRHETALSLACAQNASSGSAASLNEDCLYLNVWAPEPKPTAAPVMVWIHGGGNFAGGTDDKVPMTEELWFDGRVFAERHGVVLVTINYRLGPMGFFAHAGLAAEGGAAGTGNQGLWDQNFALHWVQSNIAAFGGDPGNVTIFGESAGSADVCYHVASPRSQGLFHRAISQSGGCTADLGRVFTQEAANTALQTFVAALGCSAEPDQLACLRQKPIADIMANAMQPMPTSGMATSMPFTFPVVIDGPDGILPKSARAIFEAGEMNKVPYIMGSNTDEGSLFILGAPTPANDAEYLKQLRDRFGDGAEQIAALYPVASFAGDYRAALSRVVGDSGLICGTHDSARLAAKAGQKVFMYNFNIPWFVAAGALGVAHAAEISHVFGVPYMADAASQAVADAMNAYWARFAKTGDPNGAGAPAAWPAFAPTASDDDQRLQLDASWMVLDNFRKAECAFWRTRYAGEG